MVKKKEFIIAAVDLDNKTFIVYVISLASTNQKIDIYPFHIAQIALLIVYKATTEVWSKYTNFADIIFPDFIAELSDYIRINNYSIDLVKVNNYLINLFIT